MTRRDVLLEIDDERERQVRKFGDQSGHSTVEWLAILAEEFGESAKEAVEINFGRPERASFLRDELVQTAAVCVAWLEALDA